MPRYRPYRSPSRPRIAAFIGISAVLHVSLLFLWIADEPLDHRRPVLLKFDKRPPPDRRLLRRTVLPQIQRPLVRRPTVWPTPVAAVRPAPLTTRHNLRQGMPLPLMVTESPPPILPTVTASLLPTQRIGPQMRTGVVKGVHQEAEEIDLNMELLDVDALDTGRHRALVVVDPRERRNLKGFLYLSGIHSEAFERAEASPPLPRSSGWSRSIAERRTLQGLADKMSERTGVRAQVLDGIALDDPRLMQVPFLLLTVNYEVAFTQAEAKNLGRYLTSGGFLYADIVSYPLSVPGGFQHDLPALRDFIRQAFQQIDYAEHKDWSFVRLPPDHPLYHCFYDVDTLPRGFHDIGHWYVNTANRAKPLNYLEGIEVNGHIVGFYSQKRYPELWAGEAERIREANWVASHVGRFTAGADELPAYDLGINILVYVLTREGSLVRQLVAVD